MFDLKEALTFIGVTAGFTGTCLVALYGLLLYYGSKRRQQPVLWLVVTCLVIAFASQFAVILMWRLG
jgi:RsiW-degrading membrane proteinase PrsW (M82 family)